MINGKHLDRNIPDEVDAITQWGELLWKININRLCDQVGIPIDYPIEQEFLDNEFKKHFKDEKTTKRRPM